MASETAKQVNRTKISALYSVCAYVCMYFLCVCIFFFLTLQEKNMRALEYQYKRSMEEEQEEFGQDLLNLQADVGEIK